MSDIRKALEDAARSLETISTRAGTDEFLTHWRDVRGYAANRALVARAALAQPAEPNKRTTGWSAPGDRYVPPVLFNPYTGEPRDVRDVQTDPQGMLIVPPGASILAAQPAEPAAQHSATFRRMWDESPVTEPAALSDEQIIEIYCQIADGTEWAIGGLRDAMPFARAIERAVKGQT